MCLKNEAVFYALKIFKVNCVNSVEFSVNSTSTRRQTTRRQMETMFYDENSLLATTTRKTLENTALKLNLSNDKLLDIGSKKDELCFGDLADFLVSPDIGISSPDLENLVWKEWSSTIKPSDITNDLQLNAKQELNQTTQVVTKEQEVFAYGFTEALKRLQETEKKEIELPQDVEESNLQETSESSEGSSDESTTSPENNLDRKITFISYNFNSKEPLPSFQEAFSKFIVKKERNSPVKVKLEKKLSNCETMATDPPTKNESCSFEWDNVETVDEGFCSREEINCHDLTDKNYMGNPNVSLAWQTNENADLFKHKSNVGLLDSFSSASYDTICDIDMLDDHDTSQKHWLTTQTNLGQLETASGL